MSTFTVRAAPYDFGATVEGLDLARPLADEAVDAIRAAWLEYQVLSFPGQLLDHPALERFTRYFGPFGEDPYVAPVAGHEHILEVRREPDEEVSPFGGAWHSDWSFQARPPSATILHAKIVPPVGGETLYADGCRAYETLDPALRNDVEALTAIHSARRPYSHEGFARSRGRERSMTILPSDRAWDTQEHPLVRTHPETRRKALWVNPVYTIGLKDLSERESDSLLRRLFDHALQEKLIYRHVWSPNMLTMWDNRSVQHCAQGGYDGHLRVMHRTIVAGDEPF